MVSLVLWFKYIDSAYIWSVCVEAEVSYSLDIVVIHICLAWDDYHSVYLLHWIFQP